MLFHGNSVCEYMFWQFCEFKYFPEFRVKMENTAGADIQDLELPSGFKS
jgi:hypothetical protein